MAGLRWSLILDTSHDIGYTMDHTKMPSEDEKGEDGAKSGRGGGDGGGDGEYKGGGDGGGGGGGGGGLRVSEGSTEPRPVGLERRGRQLLFTLKADGEESKEVWGSTRMDLSMAQLYLALSVWYDNMQELPLFVEMNAPKEFTPALEPEDTQR